MKRLLLLIFFIPFILPSQTFAWSIDSFTSDIQLQPDGRVRVKETISVDFGMEEKHGIYRDIPYVYQGENGEETYTTIDSENVLQDEHEAETKVTREDGTIRIRIGDADKTITGKHTYVLEYVATGVLRSYGNYDELYWNVTGNNWEVPIAVTTATVRVPEDKIERGICFEGYTGSTSECRVEELSPRLARFASTEALEPGEEMTIAVAYTKGMVPILTVAPPKRIEDELFTLPSLLGFPLALLLGITAIFVLWWRNGRDFWYETRRMLNPSVKGKPRPLTAHEPLVVEFTPPEGLRPAELGVLMDEKADTLDVTATLIDLATRGYLSITEVPKKWLFGATDYTLTKKQKAETDLLPYEQELLKNIFSTGDIIQVSSLKTTFYDELQKVKDTLYEDVQKKHFFVSSPESTRGKYIILGIVIVLFGGFLIFFGVQFILAPLATFGGGVILSGLLLGLFSKSMPRRTAQGRALYLRGKGYELFVSKAEKYRQQFFERKNMFNEVLPYAIVFGVTEKFAKAMDEMGVKPNTTWYHGHTPFNTVNFGRSVNTFSSAMGTAIASTPSKSGGFSGGSSGGGFGGGGGGSW